MALNSLNLSHPLTAQADTSSERIERLVNEVKLSLKVDSALAGIYARLFSARNDGETQKFLDAFGAASNVYEQWEVVEAWKV